MTATDPQIRHAITQAAAAWYVAHRASPLSEADRTEFLAWLKASPMHIEEYLGVAALERSLAASLDAPFPSVDDWVALARAEPSTNVVQLTAMPGGVAVTRERPRRRWRGIAAAACVGVVGVSTLWLIRDGHRQHDLATFRTGHGEQGTWPLSDGSTLHVNTDTTVTVRFSASERLLEIDHGQVAIEVAHGDSRAFRVNAGTTDAVAVGTEFDVYRRPDATLITVVTGQVAVSVGHYVPPRSMSTGLPRGMRVRAGQQVRVSAGKLSAPAATEVEEITAWLEHKIIFEQRELGAVADEFNRYNDIPFTIDDPALRHLPISGTFNTADTESFASFLDSLDGVKVLRLPNRFEVSNSVGKRPALIRKT